MNYSLIIAHLRQRCPTFVQRVGGAAEFKDLREKTTLAMPHAFVMPLDETVGDQTSQNGYRQLLHESFAVVVILSNAADERGQTSSNQLDAVRLELWKALLAWAPEEQPDPVERCYDPISYEGGNVIKLTREALFYQFEFGADFHIGVEHTYQKVDLDASPAFETVHITLQQLDPASPTPPGGEEKKPQGELLIGLPQ